MPRDVPIAAQRCADDLLALLPGALRDGPPEPGDAVLDVAFRAGAPCERWFGAHIHRTDDAPFPGGLVPVELHPEAPSRAYLKIEEAIARFELPFARGQRVELELDEEHFVGGGVYLFGSVLDRFLGLYTTLNSFSVLRVRTRQRKEALNEWPPRAGWKALV